MFQYLVNVIDQWRNLPLAFQVIIFLEPLLDYADTAGAMLLLHGM
jgi:hypothetical protein